MFTIANTIRILRIILIFLRIKMFIFILSPMLILALRNNMNFSTLTNSNTHSNVKTNINTSTNINISSNTDTNVNY